MPNRIRIHRGFTRIRASRGIVALLVVLSGVSLDRAKEDAAWSLLLEPMYMDAYGHDQHVLTIHERDMGSTPLRDTNTPVTLDTEGGLAHRFEVLYTRGTWGLGLDFFWFDTSQGRPSRSGAAGGPSGTDEVVFVAADRSFTSNDPSEVLFYRVLEDTDIATWTADLYGRKSLIEDSGRRLELQFGLRNADFDNDYHAAIGFEGSLGSLIDASSNYGRMTGPLVGLRGEVALGRSTLRAYLGQSLVFGTAELSILTRDFTGPLIDPPNVVSQDSVQKDQDVAVPITEFRIGWLYPVTRRLSLGVAANTSVWWDVPVPPGVVPITGGGGLFHENTISYFGVGVSARLAM